MRIHFSPILLPSVIALACSGAAGCSGSVDNGTFEDSSIDPNVPSGSGASPATGSTGNGTAAGASSGSNPGGGSAQPDVTVAPSAPSQHEPDPPVVNPDGSLAAPMDLEGSPLYSRMVRLTNAQWSAAVKDLLRLPTAPSTVLFETPAELVKLFNNNEALLEVTNTQYGHYQLSAEEIARTVAASDAALRSVYAGTDSEEFIRTFGRRVYRRPLTSAEVARYQAVFDTGAQLSGSQSAFTKGAGLVIESMLQNPYFLYRPELGDDGAALNGFEVASKLSFWLMGTTPSDALLDKAEAGSLDTPDGLAAEAAVMLETPAAQAMMLDLHSQVFEFKRFRDVSKTEPAYTGEAMNAELVASAEAFFDNIFTKGLGLKELLTSTQGFVGPELAGLYGITPAPRALTQMDLGPARTGFFAQVPYLMVYGNQASSDAIHRGVKLHRRVLCGQLGIPSPVVMLVDPQPNWTTRDRVEATTGPGTCGGDCHGKYINPLGYSLENFDGLGRERETDNGQPVNTAASYPLTGGEITFNGAPDLMQQIAGSEMAHRCYARNLAGYALQRDIVAADMPLLDEMKTLSMTKGSIKELILDLVKNPAFRTRTGGAQ